MRVIRQIGPMCVASLTLAGCMALPFASWQAHEYEGDLAPNSIIAVEGGRRVTFAQVTVTRRQNSPYNVHPEVLLVAQANSSLADPPTWPGRIALSDHTLLERIHNESPLYRRPQRVGETLGYEPTLIPWDTGYVVATRPFAVAFPVERDAFATAKAELARGELSARLNTQGFLTGQMVAKPPGTTQQQYNFRVPWVEPGVLQVRVDVVEILEDAETLRVIRLRGPMTIDALLDVMATPAGIKPHAAEEIRQPRMLPVGLRKSATRYPGEYPRL